MLRSRGAFCSPGWRATCCWAASLPGFCGPSSARRVCRSNFFGPLPSKEISMNQFFTHSSGYYAAHRAPLENRVHCRSRCEENHSSLEGGRMPLNCRVFSLSSEGGEGWGEEAFCSSFPTVHWQARISRLVRTDQSLLTSAPTASRQALSQRILRLSL